MQPGQVLRIQNFEARDGTVIPAKRVVILCQNQSGEFLGVKSTSQDHGYGKNPNCSASGYRYHTYYIPQGLEPSSFDIDSWIQIDDVYRITLVSLLSGGMKGQITQLGVLSNSTLKDLLVCATHSKDVTLGDIDTINSFLPGI